MSTAPSTRWLTWRAATRHALYGPDGFYRRPGGGPASHFRTSAHNPLFAEAVFRLLARVDAALGRPARLDLVDVGAGRGELVGAVIALAAETDPDLARRLHPRAVELGPRPDDLDPTIVWAEEIPAGIVGLLVANEWLDNVVFDVAEVDDVDGAESVRVIEVDPATGAERLGREPTAEQAEWLARWWPLTGAGPGARAEIGLDRDAAWSAAVGKLERGLAVAIDYAHEAGRRPPFGTLTGYRDGHQVFAVPDGSCDITAHVALDACQAAAEAPASPDSRLPLGPPLGPRRPLRQTRTTQRDALHRLGVSGARPPLSLASSDPRGYLMALSAASGAAELTDPDGLGGFGWLLAQVDLPGDVLDAPGP